MEASAKISSFSKESDVYRQQRIKAVAKEFESIFTAIMLKAMRDSTEISSLLPKSTGEKIFTSLLDDEYSKLISNNESLGLASLLEKEMQKYENIATPFEQLNNKFWNIDNKLLNIYTPLSYIPTSIDYEKLFERVIKWKDYIEEAAKENSIDKYTIAAIIAQESGGNPFAVSRKGAKGLMQLIDSTASFVGVNYVYDPKENIKGGSKYLRYLLDKFNNDEKLALASYNAGPSAVEKYKGIPPYKETIDYVKSVMLTREKFKAIAEKVE
ncbi:MAG: transglycosylase SLT domain-containing protein [Chitinispirillaceae bacterium]|nr:transglycosylase SLT domain-containing protein [Chitinispirillaceae bacterium]